MSRTRNRILSAALLLPVVLFSVVWTSFALWRCQYDGLARRQCCCPSKIQKPDCPDVATGGGNVGATIAGARCCQLEQHQVDKAPADAARGNGNQTAAMFAVALAAIPAAVLPAPASPPRASFALHPPGLGRPAGRALVVQKQSFLI